MIDLHLHLDGSLSPELVIKLAKEQNIELPTTEPNLLKKYLCVPDNCESLNDYLKCFDLPLSIMQTREAISEAVFELQERLKAQGLIYAEIRFAPQLHTQKGLSQEEVILSAIEGLNRSDFKAKLILCCMRGNTNEKENLETVHLAKKYLNSGVGAVDLAGAEALFATKTFKNVFEKARELNVPFTIHAGEADGPESVRTAVEFGASRIGHGIHSIFDKDLMKVLIKRQIPLEMCPKSNFQTKAAGSVQEYPIREFFESGVKVTINTDNMTVSNTTIKDEFMFLKNNYDFSQKDFLKMMNNSIDVAFVSENEKQMLRGELQEKFESFFETLASKEMSL